MFKLAVILGGTVVMAGLAFIAGIVIDNNKKLSKMANELDDLTQEVAENTTVIGSAVTLLNSLAEQLRQYAEQPEKIRALATQLDQNSNQLAQAVEANTVSTGGGEEPTPTEPTV